MRAIFIAAVCLSASIWQSQLAGAFAGEIGDPAEPLQVAEWVKGGPVDLAEGKGKTIYVVEFWATWCPPCKETIPHLSEMAKSFKDKGVVFIGVSDEDAATVKPFVTEMGDRMDYAVAVDDARKTNFAYMKPFHVESIPHAFVVDKSGAIAWHGHPMNGLDQVVQAVVDGKWSAEIAKKAEEAAKVGKEYLELAASGGDAAKLQELGAKFLEMAGTNANVLNEFAWTLLTEPSIKGRDMEMAMKAAKAAFDASEGKEAAIIDTYARALFDTGKLVEAIDLQKKAVGLCKDEKMREELKKTLEGYEAKAGKKE